MYRRILLQIETTTINSVGTSIETYADLRYTYASIKYTSGTTDFDEGAHPNTDLEFSIRWNSDITYKLRIKYEGEYYKILHLQDIGRRDGIRLKCILWDE